MKRCSVCGVEKPLSEFHKQKQSKDGHRSQCKPCNTERASRWSRENKERIRNRKNATYYRSRTCARHGITIEQFNALLSSQDYKCPICESTLNPEQDKNAVIDHDHTCCSGMYSCGKCVRGILCQMCNKGIGQLRDSPVILKNAIDYLTKPL